MKLGATIREARRALLGNKIRSLLMMLGVIIGIATLTVIVGIGQGAKAKVMQQVNQMFGLNPIVVMAGGQFMRGGETDVSQSTVTQEDAEAIAQEISNVQQLSLVQRKGNVPIKYRELSTFTQVFGVTPNWRILRTWEVESGEFFSEAEQASAARVCLLGQTVARDLFGEGDPVGQQIRIENVTFKVTGVLTSKGSSPMGGDFDNRLVIPLSTFSRRLYNVNNLSQIVIQLHDVQQMERTATEITALMRERHHIVPPKQDDFMVRTPESIVTFASGTAQTMTLFLGVIAGISLLIGGVVIMNIMLISVKERTREIGLRRAMGARQRDILRQFLVEALIVTLIGGVLGVLLGAAGAWLLVAIKGMPIVISWQGVAAAVVFSLIVGLVFGVLPAKRAASLNPVMALRSE